MMKIDMLVVGDYQVNCFLVQDDEGHVVVIDPGAEPDRISEFIKQRNLTVAAYMMTHGHCDHLSGLADLCKTFPAPVGMHAADVEWAFGEMNQMPPSYAVPQKPDQIARLVTGGQTWTDGSLAYRVIETPGHTPGSVCYWFEDEDVLISGDTLFAGSVGRTDLRGGDSRTLSVSLKRLTELPDCTTVYPGHGPATTIGTEKRINFFMR